jgi:hypothetical protein
MLLLHMQIRRYFNKICDNRIYSSNFVYNRQIFVNVYRLLVWFNMLLLLLVFSSYLRSTPNESINITYCLQWFSPGTQDQVSSTNTTDRHDKTEILLKVIKSGKIVVSCTYSLIYFCSLKIV